MIRAEVKEKKIIEKRILKTISCIPFSTLYGREKENGI
jgi:hypothetical protein